MMIVAKGRLLVVVVLVLIASCDAAVLSPVQEQMFMGLFNFIRMMIAKKGFIANMHALSWDPKLADKIAEGAAELQSMNCDFPAFLKKQGEEKGELLGRPAFFFKEDATMKQLGEAVEKELDDGEWPDALLMMLGWELIMHPLQTTVGCALVQCPLSIPNTDVTLQLEMLCVMGPQKTFEVSDYELGKAGSECGSASSESGLCVTSGKKTEISKDMKEEKAMAKFGAKDDLGVKVAKLKKKREEGSAKKAEEEKMEKKSEESPQKTVETTTQQSDDSKIASTSIVFALIVLSYLAFQ